MNPLPTVMTATPRQLLLLKYGVGNRETRQVLTTPTSLVTADEFDDRLRQLIVDMFYTMYKANGIGLAAPQIGLSLRLAVVDISSGQDPVARIVMVNPTILAFSSKQIQTDWEGCLSLPGFREKVLRSQIVRVYAQNERGEHYELHGEGLLARAIQHEIDHLDGKLFIDRISRLRRSMIKTKIDKLRRQGRW